MCIKRGTVRTTLLIFFACLWAVGVVTSDAKATARLRSGIPLLKHLKKGAKAAGKGLANACEAVCINHLVNLQTARIRCQGGGPRAGMQTSVGKN